MKRVLVTGATGCIGRHVLPRLRAAGWEVWAIRRRPSRAPDGDVTWRQADLLNEAEARAVVEEAGATHLLHLAWYIAPGKWAAADENFDWVRASLSLAQTFKVAGGKRLVTAGSCLEYDWHAADVCKEGVTPLAPHTVYGVCKHALHQLVSALMTGDGLSSAWGRIFMLYGPHEHPDRLVASVIRALHAGSTARTSHGEQVRDYLYVDDVAAALVALLSSTVEGPVNIASGVPVRLKDVVTRIGVLMGRPDLIALGAIPAAPTDTPRVVADVDRMTQELGFHPEWDLDRGLGASIDWWRRQ